MRMRWGGTNIGVRIIVIKGVIVVQGGIVGVGKSVVLGGAGGSVRVRAVVVTGV